MTYRRMTYRSVKQAAAVLAVLLLPATQASADCKADVEGIENKLTQAKVRDTYKGREAEHPEVLLMADGRLVDLTGYIIVDAAVQESWMGDRPVVENVGLLISEAKGYADKKQEAECAGAFQKIQELLANKSVDASAPAAPTAPAQ